VSSQCSRKAQNVCILGLRISQHLDLRFQFRVDGPRAAAQPFRQQLPCKLVRVERPRTQTVQFGLRRRLRSGVGWRDWTQGGSAGAGGVTHVVGSWQRDIAGRYKKYTKKQRLLYVHTTTDVQYQQNNLWFNLICSF